MGKCYREELVGVFGYPVDENPTVVVANAAFKQMGVNYRYLTIEVKPQDLGDAMKALKAMNMKGIHLTIPHKVEVIKYLDYVADDAKIMGAVNTVYVKDGKLYGENTDGKGFIKSLQNAGVKTEGKKITMLGAGGAARAIAVELANAGVNSIRVINRSAERGRELVDLLNSKTKIKAEYVSWDHTMVINPDTDIFVNTTSIGLYPNVNDRPNIDFDSLKTSMVVCDVIPNHPHTQLIQEAQKRGIKTIDGLGMLINQAVESFRMWTGKVADAEIMKEALAKEYGINVHY
jgi:shikimate dehydrogenase